ncbi:MAG: hypothetical protein ABGZ17_30175, partial [Planctomycetaceae bacterium]
NRPRHPGMAHRTGSHPDRTSVAIDVQRVLLLPETPGLGIELNEDAFRGQPLASWRRPLIVEPDGNIGYQ